MGNGAAAIFPHWVRSTRATALLNDIILIAALLIAELPLLLLHGRSLWRRENYEFFPAILVIFGVLVWKRWPLEKTPVTAFQRLLGLSMLLFGLAALLVGVLIWSPWFGAVGTIFTVGFLLIQLAGGQATSCFAHAWLLLWLLIPPPFRLYEEAVWWLQGLSASTASMWLDTLGFHHVLTGHVIHVPGRRFVIDDSCDISLTLLMLAALSLVYAAICRYRPVHIALLLLCAATWAMLTNAVRIVLLVMSNQLDWSADLSAGHWHFVLGAGALLFGVMLLLSTDSLLFFLCLPSRLEAESPPVAVPRRNPASLAEDGSPEFIRPLLGTRSVWLVSMLFVIVGSLQTLSLTDSSSQVQAATAKVAAGHLLLREDTLTSLPGAWRFVQFAPAENRDDDQVQTATWDYVRDSLACRASLDFPFRGWYDLSVSYTSQGWEITQRQVISDGSSSEPTTIELEFEKPTGEFGYLLVSLVDTQGVILRPPTTWQQIYRGLVHRLTQRGGQGVDGPLAYQFHVFASSSSPFTREQKRSIGELHREAKRQVIGRLRG